MAKGAGGGAGASGGRAGGAIAEPPPAARAAIPENERTTQAIARLGRGLGIPENRFADLRADLRDGGDRLADLRQPRPPRVAGIADAARDLRAASPRPAAATGAVERLLRDRRDQLDASINRARNRLQSAEASLRRGGNAREQNQRVADLQREVRVLELGRRRVNQGLNRVREREGRPSTT